MCNAVVKWCHVEQSANIFFKMDWHAINAQKETMVQTDWLKWVAVWGQRPWLLPFTSFFFVLFFLRNVEEGGVWPIPTKLIFFFTIVPLPIKCWGWKKLTIPRPLWDHFKELSYASAHKHTSKYSHTYTGLPIAGTARQRRLFPLRLLSLFLVSTVSVCCWTHTHTHKDNTVLELQ